MMKSIIICEGETDFAFLQQFMIKANGWKDFKSSDKKKNPSFKPKEIKNAESRDFEKGYDMLTICSCGGCGNIKAVFEAVIRRNQNENDDDARYSKIVVLTDNDDDGVGKKIISDLISASGVDAKISNRNWTRLSFSDMVGDSFDTDLLLLVIPFDEHGALETFLLNSVSEQNPYDAEIIRKAREFVGNADPEKRYLTHRGFKTKAELYAYFSIRIDYSKEQFKQRKSILKNVPWEEYENMQESFKELRKL